MIDEAGIETLVKSISFAEFYGYTQNKFGIGFSRG